MSLSPHQIQTAIEEGKKLARNDGAVNQINDSAWIAICQLSFELEKANMQLEESRRTVSAHILSHDAVLFVNGEPRRLDAIEEELRTVEQLRKANTILEDKVRRLNADLSQNHSALMAARYRAAIALLQEHGRPGWPLDEIRSMLESAPVQMGLPKLEEQGVSYFAVSAQGEYHYINHAGVWQTCPPFPILPTPLPGQRSWSALFVEYESTRSDREWFMWSQRTREWIPQRLVAEFRRTT